MGRKSIAHLRKPEILKHTYQIIKEKGLEGASITKIAKRMGTNSGIIINNFKNKETLILELVDYMLAQTMDGYRTFIESSNLPPEEHLEMMIDYFFDPELKPLRSNVFWACFALSFRNEKTKAEIRKMYLFFINELIRFLDNAQAGGKIKIKNKELLAHVLLTAIEGIGYLKLTRGNTPIVSETYTFYKNSIKNMLNLKEVSRVKHPLFAASDHEDEQQTEHTEDALSSGIIDLNFSVSTEKANLMDELDAACVEWGMLFSSDNRQIAEMVKNYPDRLKGAALIDPHNGNASRRTEQAIKKFGFSGIHISPSHCQIPANDPKFFPVYAKADELGVPVFIQSSMSFNEKIPMDLGRPAHIDTVAMSFPDLNIASICGGWPWVNEMVGVARRHRNVFIVTSFNHPEDMTAEEAGWGMLLQFGNTLLQDRIIFGSSDRENGFSLLSVIQKARHLPLKQKVRQKWMYQNAAILFK